MRSLLAFSLSALVLACGPQPPFRAGQGSTAPRAEGAEQVRVRRLLVAFRGAEGASEEITRTREAALERANLIAGLLSEPGASFREIVNEYGDVPPDTDDRTRIRVLDRDAEDWPDALKEPGLRLSIGQVTRPIETPMGYVILMREPEGEAPSGPATIGARHILISYRGASSAHAEVTRTEREAGELARQIAAFARDGSHDWNELHRRYSDERGGPEGGDLGVFGRGEMVPSFERAAFALDVNEISDPIQSQYGFHIIQRTR